MTSSDESLRKAYLPSQLALKYHPFYRGKIEIVPKCPIRSFDDFAIWYTPGVAEACESIKNRPEAVFEFTNKWNTIAIVTDGSRVLGLGDIGPEAGLPVMEGKALLYKYLGGIDAFPVCLGTKKTEEIISAVKWIQPSFAGINLEDIAQPKCFEILDALQQQLDVPVWHDDQQGTATVVLAGFLNALKVVGKKISDVQISMIGAGAANVALARLLTLSGANPGNLILVDSKGILHRNRNDLRNTPKKWHLCQTTNSQGREGGIEASMIDTDACIALSTPGPGVISKDSVAKMNDHPIVFACANPVPEIWPWEAEEAGAAVVATGRSDFSNQLNNSLGFPGIFRGTIDVRARTITDDMCLAAASELARLAEERGLSAKNIVPTMDDWEVFPREATAVADKAMAGGVARLKRSREELYTSARSIIKRAREQTKDMMRGGFIQDFPT
ncbi:MAG TPA: NADP-dependent malic enzyme [Candidatus Acidoferrales bacterium]|nr:NADP-dependent malic enzyme [Candidatus Acidoferrales bacterium]